LLAPFGAPLTYFLRLLSFDRTHVPASGDRVGVFSEFGCKLQRLAIQLKIGLRPEHYNLFDWFIGKSLRQSTALQ